MRWRCWSRAWVTALCLTTCTSCSVRQAAVNVLGDAVARGGAVYARDDDPELVGEAVPFALKTSEALLEASPRHRALLLSAASGFAQYAFGYVQQQADFAEATDLARASVLRGRAKRLYLRGRDYGLRGLELDAPGLLPRLRDDPTAATAWCEKRHVPFLYWTGVAWFAAISLAKDDAELSVDQYIAEALLRRALALDEGFERGVVHDALIAWEARGELAGGSFARARAHLDSALTLSRGARAWPLVAFAEAVCVARQDRREFVTLIERALAVDPDGVPAVRLINLIAQRRARWLRGRMDELFVE